MEPQRLIVNNAPLALTVNQRNIYNYFLNHKKKHQKQPCFVPRSTTQASRLDDYLTALQRLEEYNLISVDRNADNYTGWIIKDPTER